MAKSIYEILADLTTETSVPKVENKDGKILRENFGMVQHTIPREMLPTVEQFENEELLLEWFKEAGFLHAGLQTAVQKRLIDLRAIFKSMGKDDKWSPELGQAKLDKAEWTVTERPNAKGSKAISKAVLEVGSKMAQSMADAGIDESTIKQALNNTYKSNEVAAIMDSLNN